MSSVGGKSVYSEIWKYTAILKRDRYNTNTVKPVLRGHPREGQQWAA